MKYSIEEIDEMRNLLHEVVSLPWGSDPKITEARLRTLMMNGTSVEEVREYHKKRLTEFSAMYGTKVSS